MLGQPLRELRSLRLLAFTASAFFFIPSQALAHEFYASRVPRTATAMNASGQVRVCINCHSHPDGGAGCVDEGGSKPCLNPFGTQFRSNGFNWDPGLASMDADGDGFTNGQELQDPSGSWTPGFEAPGVAEYVTRPGFDTFNPGQTDGDGDGFCWFGRDMDNSGDCLGAGENDGSFDCDDAVSTVNSGATELCTNPVDDDCNGLDTLADPVCADVVDQDGDGVCPMGSDNNGDRDCIDAGEATGLVDCDDMAITVFPGNPENCTDGIDNDCNERADMADDSCRNDIDNDGDGFCPLGQNLNPAVDNDCLDPGEIDGGSDCDDTDSDINSGQVELCTDGKDNDCDGDADSTDSECESLFDVDNDGFCPGGQDLNDNGNCFDVGENITPFDCNDGDANVNPNAAELCTNNQDDDCDGSTSLTDLDCVGFLDTDGDDYCSVGFDMNGDGDCVDPGEEGGRFIDCDDTRPDIVPAVGGTPTAEVCTDGVDNNCDGSTDAFDPECRDHRDLDGDGWCEVGPDLDANGTCTESGEQAGVSDASMRDRVVDDSTIFPGAPENCFDRKDNDQDDLIDEGVAQFDGDPRDIGTACTRDVDLDGDGWCPIGQDMNSDGDCLDPGENIGVSDCDDTDDGRNPGATELCRNLLDEDCDGDVDLFDSSCLRLLDRDGDGFCGEGVDDNKDGDCLDEEEDRFGVDCDDTNELISVRAQELCSDTIDNDCDGNIDIADSQCTCSAELCDDNDPCTTDTCVDDNTCTHTPDATCGDGGTMDGGTGGSGDDCASGSPSRGNLGWLLALFLGLLVWRRRGGQA